MPTDAPAPSEQASDVDAACEGGDTCAWKQISEQEARTG